MTDRLEIPEKLSDWEKGGIVEHIGSDEEHTDTFYRHGNLGAEQDKDGTWEAYTIVDGHPIKVKGDMMSFEEVVEFFKGSFCSKKLAGKDEDTHDESPDIDDEPEHPEPDGEMGITLVLKSITEMMSDEYDGCAVMKSKKGGDGRNPNVRRKPKNLSEFGENRYANRDDMPTRDSEYVNEDSQIPKSLYVSHSDIPHRFPVFHNMASDLNKPLWNRSPEIQVANEGDLVPYVTNEAGGIRHLVHMGMTPRQAQFAAMRDAQARGHGDKIWRFVTSPAILNKNHFRNNEKPFLFTKREDGSIEYPMFQHKIGSGDPKMGNDYRYYNYLNNNSVLFNSPQQRSRAIPGTAGGKHYARGTNVGDVRTIDDWLRENPKEPSVLYNDLSALMDAILESKNTDIRNYLDERSRFGGTLFEFNSEYPGYTKKYDTAVRGMMRDVPFSVQLDWMNQKPKDLGEKYKWVRRLPEFGNVSNAVSSISELTPAHFKSPEFDSYGGAIDPRRRIAEVFSGKYASEYEPNKAEINRAVANSIMKRYPNRKDVDSISDPIGRFVIGNHWDVANRILNEVKTNEDLENLLKTLGQKHAFLNPTKDMISSINAYEYGGVPVIHKEGSSDEVSAIKDRLLRLNDIAVQTGIAHDPSFRAFFKENMTKKLSNISPETLDKIGRFLKDYEGKYGTTAEEALVRDFDYANSDEYDKEYSRRGEVMDDILMGMYHKGQSPEEILAAENWFTSNFPKNKYLNESVPEPVPESMSESAPVTADATVQTTLDSYNPNVSDQDPTPTELGKEIVEKEEIDSTSENPLMKSISVMIMEKMSGDLTEPCDQEPNLMPLNEYPRSIIMGAGKVAIPDPQQVIAHDTYRTYPVKNFPENFPGDGE